MGISRFWLDRAADVPLSDAWDVKDTQCAPVNGRPRSYPPLVGPDGTVYRDIANLSAFCRGLGMRQVHRVVTGEWESYKGWHLLREDGS